MSITIPHLESGEPVEVYARLIPSEVGPSYIECLCRAESEEVWTAAALANGLLREDTYEDEQGNPVSEIGSVYGVNIFPVGPVQTSPGTYDEDGNELTAPVYDTRHHVNFRIAEHLNWQPIALAWMTYGTPDPEQNKSEQALKLSGIALIDPDTISTPAMEVF